MPFRFWKLDKMARWSGLVAIFLLSFWLASAQEKPPRPVSMVFYNLKNYLAMKRRVNGEVVDSAPKPENEIRQIIEGLKPLKPDILAVCEMGSREYLDDFQNRLKTVGLNLPHVEMVHAAGGFERNLALLSRFPITSTNSRNNYTYRIKGDALPFQRGVLDATIKINPEYELRCVVLHLKSKREIAEADQLEMRLQEANLARRHIDKILQANPDTNLIVIGDLNDDRQESPVKTLQGFFGGSGYLTALNLSDQFGFRWTHYWEFADVYSRFDYALLSRGLSPEVDQKQSRIHHWPNWNVASDHRPIVVSILPTEKN